VGGSRKAFGSFASGNRGGPTFLVLRRARDGQQPMGVHTALGPRTLKDVFQRYKAYRGFRRALPERLRLPGALDRGGGRA